MTNESRILTVSYGTFSCTLEGFDDPFNTMKAIAEYFRDLAAEDRYFGAEPLQPDAAMLHRVADREVSRLVGAKAREAGLVIRRSDLEAAEARLSGQDHPAPEAQIEPVAEAVAEPPPVEPALQAAMPIGVVAKLSRIREAISRPLDEARATPALPEDVLNAFREEIEEPIEEPAPAPVAEAAPPATDPVDAAGRIGALLQDPDAGATATESNIFADLAPSDMAADVAFAPAEAPAEEGEAPFIEVDDLEVEALEAQSFQPVSLILEPDVVEAEPVSEAIDAVADDALMAEDPDADSALAQDLPADALDVVAGEDAAGEAIADEAWSADPLADETLTDETAFDEALAEEDLALSDASLDSYEEEAAEALASLNAATDAEVASEAEPLVLSETMAEAWTDAAASEPEDLPVGVEAVAPDDMQVDEVADLALDAALPEEVAEIAEDLADRPTVTEDTADIEAPLPYTRFATKSQRVSSRIVRLHASEDEAAEPPTRAATRMVSPDEADDLARLMRQADDVMADEENRRRIESLAHLKAAVAAAEADRAAGEAMRTSDASDDEAYREDLSQVVIPDEDADPADVRPRRKTVSVRPQEPRPGTIRPGMVSPPPLVLVSEQRVDRIVPTPEVAPAARAPAAPLPTGPAQPGIEGHPMAALRTGRLTGAIGVGAAAASPMVQTERVVLNRATPAPAADMDDDEGLDEHLTPGVESGLASFAERVGVKSMADMLEAAAAYATCIERREQFTRPQLMRRLMASAGGKPVSREDGLRSFGTLLRTGRIEKVGRGHYVLAEQSPYLAEARRFR